MKKVLRSSQVLTIVLVTLALSSVFLGVEWAWAADGPKPLSMSTVEDATILQNGGAQLSLLINVAAFPLADMYRKMLAAPLDAGVGQEMPIPENKTENGVVVPVRQEFYRSVKQEQKSSFGFTTWISDSSMTPRGDQNEVRVSINAYALLQVVNFTAVGSDGLWEIVVGPKDGNATLAAAGLVFTSIAFAQQMLGSLEGDQIYEISKSLRIKVPAGATLLNGDELAGLSWTVNLGGGTSMSASVSLDDPSTVVLNERTVVTEQSITATPTDIFEAFRGYKVFRIKYLLPGSAFVGESDWASDSDWSCSWEWPWSDSFSVPFGYSFPIGGGAVAKIDATLTITPSFTLSGYMGWDFHWYGSLNWFKAWIGASASVKVRLEVTATAEITKTWEKTLFDYTLYRFTFSIDYVPVWIDLNLSLIASLTVGAYATVSFTVETDVGASFKGGVQWTDDDGWSTIKEANAYAHLTGPTITSVEVGAWIEPSLKVRVSFLLYSVSGPYLEFQPYIRGTLTYYALDEVGTWEITTGFRLNVGVTFNGWLKNLLDLSDHYYTLYDWTIKEWSGHWGQAPSSISINLDPTATCIDGATMITGTISSPYEGNKGGTVIIEYSTDNTNWIELGETTSRTGGEYSFFGGVSEAGNFYVRSRWNGNSGYKGSESGSVPLIVSSVISGPQWMLPYFDQQIIEMGDQFWPELRYACAVRLTPPTPLWILDKFKVYGAYIPNPNTVLYFHVRVWDSNLNDLFQGSYPMSDYFPQVTLEPPYAGDWTPDIDIPDVLVSGDFYIVIWGDSYPQQGGGGHLEIGEDHTLPSSGHSYVVDAMIHSIIYGSTEDRNVVVAGMSLVEDHYMYARRWVWVQIGNYFVHVLRDIKTNTFYIDEDYAYSWVKFRATGSNYVTWIWRSPDDTLGFSTTYQMPSDWNGEALGYLEIEANRLYFDQHPEWLGRPFKVDVYLNFDLAFTETFIVIKHESSIWITLSSDSVAYGQSVQVSSQLSPAFSDGTATLQYSTDEVNWINVASGTPSTGYYSYNWIPPHAGTYYLRAVWSGNANYGGNTSSTITLTVNPAPTSLTTILSANTITYGTSVTITVSMAPALQGRNVTIQYSDDSITWYTLDLGTTDSAGQNASSWTPPAQGVYYIRSTWYGDTDYLGANSPSQKLTVEWAPLSTIVEIVSGANAEVDRTPDAIVEFAVKVKDQMGQYLKGIGKVEFYVSDYPHYNIIFAGSDNDTDADGVYHILWNASSWPTLGPQHWSAWFTGTPQYNESLVSTDFTIYYYGSALWIDPTFQAVNVTASKTYAINFKWNRDSQSTFALSLAGLNPSWYTLSQTSITVDSKGQTVQVTLTVTPPKAPTILTDYDFTVTATNATGFSVSATATLRVDFKPTRPTSPQGGLAIAVQPKTIYMSTGTTLQVNIYIKNNQNFDDVITVDITNSGIPAQYQAKLTWFIWTRVRVFIPAGGSITISLRITLPSNTPPPGGTLNAYLFSAVATSTANLAISAKDSGIIRLQ